MQRFAVKPTSFGILAACVCMFSAGFAEAQLVETQAIQFKVSQPNQQLEMIVNTSRILTLDHIVPKMLVMNPDIVQASPLSPNQVQISARRPGVTQLNLWDEKKQVYTVDLLVVGDARQLQALLKAEFPNAELKVRPLATSVVVSGFVPSAGMVSRVVRMAEDYYPNVINNITVGGVQTVLLHTKVMEVSRTKLRTLGFDWAQLNGGNSIVQSAAGLIVGSGATATGSGGETISFGIVNGNNSFFGFLEALRQYNLVKVLAEPTLVTVSGRPASFNSGGEFPIMVPQSLGTVSVEYRQFGTRVDFVPIVLGNGSVRLEVRPTISEIDPSRSVTINNVTVPGLRTRWVDTAVEMKAGQTLALAGLIQNRVETENKGLPWLADLPWFGSAFRRVQESHNEIELLIMVTPEFVDAMDPHEVPPCGPGQTTGSPNDIELYARGYLEVPNCGNCGNCDNCQQQQQFNSAPYGEEVHPLQRPLPNAPASETPRALPPTKDAQTRGGAPTVQQSARYVPTRQSGIRQPGRYNRNIPRLGQAPVANVSTNTLRSRQYQSAGNPSYPTYNPTPAYGQRVSTQNVQTVANGTDNRNSSQIRLIGPVGYDVLK